MNDLVKKNQSLKCGFVIKILSIIALICTLLSSISYFFYYSIDEINGEKVYSLTFFSSRLLRFFDGVEHISLLLSIALVVLFIFYLYRFHNKLKATVLVPIIFCILAFETLFNLVNAYLPSLRLLQQAAYRDYAYLFYGYFSKIKISREHTIILLILQLLIIVSCILALISALKGLNKKIYVIITMSLCLLFKTVLFVAGCSTSLSRYNIENSLYLDFFNISSGIIGSISFYVALLLFAVNNRISSIIISTKRKSVESLNHEQALRILKDKLDFGMITEEEYQAQRSEIISKL